MSHSAEGAEASHHTPLELDDDTLQIRIIQCRRYLLKKLRTDEIVMRETFDGVLSESQTERVRNKMVTGEEKAAIFLEYIIKSPDPARWSMLRKILQQPDHSYVAEILRSGDCEELLQHDQEQERVVENFKKRLIDGLDPIPLCQMLRQEGMLTQSEEEKVRATNAHNGSSEANSMILMYIPRSRGWFEKFVKILWNFGHKQLVTEMAPDSAKYLAASEQQSENYVVGGYNLRTRKPHQLPSTARPTSAAGVSKTEDINKMHKKRNGAHHSGRNKPTAIVSPGTVSTRTDLQEDQRPGGGNEQSARVFCSPTRQRHSVENQLGFTDLSHSYSVNYSQSDPEPVQELSAVDTVESWEPLSLEQTRANETNNQTSPSLLRDLDFQSPDETQVKFIGNSGGFEVKDTNDIKYLHAQSRRPNSAQTDRAQDKQNLLRNRPHALRCWCGKSFLTPEEIQSCDHCLASGKVSSKAVERPSERKERLEGKTAKENIGNQQKTASGDSRGPTCSQKANEKRLGHHDIAGRVKNSSRDFQTRFTATSNNTKKVYDNPVTRAVQKRISEKALKNTCVKDSQGHSQDESKTRTAAQTRTLFSGKPRTQHVPSSYWSTGHAEQDIRDKELGPVRAACQPAFKSLDPSTLRMPARTSEQTGTYRRDDRIKLPERVDLANKFPTHRNGKERGGMS